MNNPQQVHFATRAPFSYGSIVLITLNAPREKFWGAIIEITPSGVSTRGIDLGSFDEITAMIRSDDPVAPSTVFFPLNRVERIELDLSSVSIPSLSDRFLAKSGQQAAVFLGVKSDGERCE